jgi:predicted outer membrane repeat protein
MKIGIPVEEASINSKVSSSFGRTAYFLVYELDTETSLFIQNTAAESSGGAGIKAAQLLTDQNVNGVLAPQMGENAALVFSEANIPLYRSMSGSITDAIAAYKNGTLTLLDHPHSGHHKHG